MTHFRLLCKRGIALTILILFCPALPAPHTPLLPTLLSCSFYINDYESIQKQDTFGSITLVPPFLKHMFCVATVFVLLFIFKQQFRRENISLLLQTKWYVESSNRQRTYQTSQETNFEEMLRKAVVNEDGRRKEEVVSEGCVRGSRDRLSGKGWPPVPAQQFRLGFKMPQMWSHNKLVSTLLPTACAYLFSTLSCVLQAWKARVAGSGYQQPVWFPGMGSSTYGRDGRKSSRPVLELVARIPWRPSIARQTGEKLFPYAL